MTLFKTMIAAALVSMAAVTSASAQLPNWAAQDPDAFQAQYPDRDVLNGGALIAGRMGPELPARLLSLGHAILMRRLAVPLPHPALSSIIPTTPHLAPFSVTMSSPCL